MHIQLLPPILPPQRTLSPDGPRVVLTPGQRVTATVLTPDLEGRSMLAFAGRELASRTPLPFPPGATVVLEVITVEGEVPQLRVVPDEAEPAAPVAVGTYAYAAAVLAAGGGADVAAAAQGLVRWLPMLVARGVLTPRQADALVTSLGRVIVREPGHGASGGPPSTGVARDLPSAEALIQALQTRVAAETSSLEARMSAALRRDGAAGAERVLAAATRGQLAALRRAVATAAHEPGASADLGAAEQAVDALLEAQLADQARVAALFARDGVLALRLPLTVGTHEIDLHLRVRDEPDEHGADNDEASRPRVHRIQLDLDLERLGAVQAHLLVTGDDVRIELLTAEPGAADALESDLASLSTALMAAGFGDVLTRVAIDPVRVASGEVPLALPPEGSILQADA